MYLNKLIKKQAILIISTFLIVTALIGGVSYAAFERTFNNTEDQTITAGDLSINFAAGSVINITSLEPMPDSTATSRSDNLYTFTITNNGQIPYIYNVKLNNNPDYTSNLLGHAYIRLKVDSGSASTLSSLTDHIIASGTLEAGQSKTYNVRIWIADADSYSLPNTAIGQEVHLKISVDGKALGE